MYLRVTHTATILFICIAVVTASPHPHIPLSIPKRPSSRQNQPLGSYSTHKHSTPYFVSLESLIKASVASTRALHKQSKHNSLRYVSNHNDMNKKLHINRSPLRFHSSKNAASAYRKKLVSIKQLNKKGVLLTSTRNGVNFDFCESDTDCLDPRSCGFFSDGEFVPCQSGEDCICLSETTIECLINSDCDSQEVCAVDLDGDISLTFCASENAVDSVTSWEVAGTGLNFFPCTSDNDCENPRLCVDDDNASCSAGADCLCLPSEQASCSTSADCDLGEVCTIGGNIENPLCVSAFVVEATSDLRPVDPISTPGASPGASPQASPESLPSASPNSSPLASLASSPSAPPPGPSTPQASPEPLPSTSSPSATPQPSGNPATSLSPTASSALATSPSPTPTPSEDTGGGICIDATALEQFAPTQLVFQTHSLANVLCDINQSCATPGHMVSYHGAPMMMRSYCALVGCVKRMIHVNSPRYRRGLRVKSRTSGLEYTAFAARYETRAEETVMQVALRVGL